MSDQNTVETVEQGKKIFGATASGQVYAIPLACVGTYNVRKVLPRMPEGYTYESLIRLAIGTAEQKAEFIRIVDEHEAETLRLDPKAHTIIMLAESIYDQGQLQPIVVRQTGTASLRDTEGKVIPGEKRYGYMIIMGSRRAMATAYLVAMDVGVPPTVMGRQVKMSKDEAMAASIAENLQRKDFTLGEIGEFVAAYRDQGKSWAEIAEIMRRSEPTLRAAYLIVRPEATDAPTDLADQVAAGLLTKGQAVQIATGKTTLGDGGERLFRTVRKTISVRAIEDLIDTTERDEAGLVRITAFAECLGSTLADELASADARKAKEIAKVEAARVKAEKEAAKAEADQLKAAAKELTDRAKALTGTAKVTVEVEKTTVTTETVETEAA